MSQGVWLDRKIVHKPVAAVESDRSSGGPHPNVIAAIERVAPHQSAQCWR